MVISGPTLLTLASLYTSKFFDYQDSTFPKVHDGIRENVVKLLQTPFDFIIVGSGFSGSFLARKLAHGGCYRVLVIECGGMPSFDSAIPFVTLGNMSKHMWDYSTVPQKHAAKGMKEEKVKLMIPKTLGGTSVLEDGIYIPANLDDFHRWSYIYQLPGWSYADMKRYAFELSQSENDILGVRVHPLELLNLNDTKLLNMLDEGFHERVMDPLKYAWLRTASHMKQPIRYGEEQDLFTDGGFFVPKTLSLNGMKINPAGLYLKDMAENLVILCHVLPEKLLYDAANNNIFGLQVKDEISGQKVDVRASKQVILTAGAIDTAKLLIQSGIGPAEHLNQEKIPVISNLPVGTRLIDRVKATLYIKVDSVAMESLRSEVNDPHQLDTFLNNGTGVLANTSVIGAALLKTQNLFPTPSADLMLELKPAGLLGMDRIMKSLNFKEDMIHQIDPDGVLNKDGFMEISMTIMRPFSQGTMWLWRHSDSTFTPKMNPAYLTDKRDLNSLVAEMIDLGNGVHCVLTKKGVYINVTFNHYKNYCKYITLSDVQYSIFSDFADSVMGGLPDPIQGETVITSMDLGNDKKVSVCTAIGPVSMVPYVIKFDGVSLAGKPYVVNMMWRQFVAWYKIRHAIDEKIEAMRADDYEPASNDYELITTEAISDNQEMYESLAALLLYKLVTQKLPEGGWRHQPKKEYEYRTFEEHCELQVERLLNKAAWILNVFDLICTDFSKKPDAKDYQHKWQHYYLETGLGRSDLFAKALMYNGKCFNNICAAKCRLIWNMYESMVTKDE